MKKTVVIVISLLIILGMMVIGMISIFNDKQRISGDSLKFKEEYEILNGKYYEEGNVIASNLEIEKNNPYIYLNENDVLDKLNNGTHIIFFGNPECGWSRRVVPVLTEFANKNKIDKIYYYNILMFKNNNEILDEISSFVIDEKVLTPIVFFIKDGKIIGSHYKLVDNYNDFNIDLTEEQKRELLNTYQIYYDKMFMNVCEEDC